MSSERHLAVIILAAGRGKRMNVSLPKVLHPVGGKPMLLHVVRTAKDLKPYKIVIIVGKEIEQVMKALNDEDVTLVHQKERLGTGHAVLQARKEFAGFDGKILVLSGDVPLLSQMTLDKLLNKHYVSNVAATVLTTIFDNPAGYGRTIRNGAGNLDRIVEDKDCTESQRRIQEINAGIYLFNAPLLFQYLPQVGNDNAQQEYYLPDVLSLMKSSGKEVAIDQVSDCREVAGVNNQEQLDEVNRIYRELHEKH